MTTEAPSEAQQTWTFVGHWEDDRIVIDYVLDGEQEDDREDVGEWEQGLWAASASGATIAEAEAAAVDEYEAPIIAFEQEGDKAPTGPVSYETSGTEPNRTIAQSAGGTVVHMMSEIDGGLFVAWDRCSACHTHISHCECPDGPTESEIIGRWRAERNPKPRSNTATSRDESTGEAGITAKIDAGLDQALDAVREASATEKRSPDEFDPEF